VDALLLALRGLRARRGTSAVVVAVGLFASAAAATGPLYLAAAGESVLRDTLRAAPVAATGLEVRRETTAGRLAQDVVEDAVDAAVDGDPAYPVRTTALEQDGTVVVAGSAVARTRLTARDGSCAQVVVLRGRCPQRAGEVLVSEEGAGSRGA
jgi:putative ABC transport system permease protein